MLIFKPKTKNIIWKNIKEEDEFIDGSKVVGIHETTIQDSYVVGYYNSKKNQLMKDALSLFKKYDDKNETVLSGDHILLVDLKEVPTEVLKAIDAQFGDKEIPTVWNRHVYYQDPDTMSNDIKNKDIDNISGLEKAEVEFKDSYMEKMEVAQSDPAKVSETEFWLPVITITELLNQGFKLYSNGHLLSSKYRGKLEVFCVETDTHKYETNGLIHHNSVLLQNIIFHALTHGNDVTIAMVDLKRTEMPIWKKHKNVMYVANTVQEARELVLIARRLMDKRNEEMEKLGLKDIMNYKPTKFTGEIRVAGRKFTESDRIDILLPDGTEKNVSIGELEQYLIWEA